MLISHDVFIPRSWNSNATQLACHQQVLVLFNHFHWHGSCCLFDLIGFLLRSTFLKLCLTLCHFFFSCWMVRSDLWIFILLAGWFFCVFFEIYFKQYFFTDNSLGLNNKYLLIKSKLWWFNVDYFHFIDESDGDHITT